MTTLQPAPAPLLDEEILSVPEFSFWRDARKRFFRNKAAVAGLVFIAVLGVMVILKNFIQRYPYDELSADPAYYRAPPSAKHWFGTDNLGRDMWSRVLNGAYISLRLGVAVAVLATVVSLMIGGLAGYRRGWFDGVSMRLADVFFAVPYVALGFAVVAIMGPTIFAIIVISLLRGWMGGARTFRAQVMQVKAYDFIEAARATGATGWRVFSRHIVPNAIQPAIVGIGFSVGAAIVNEAAYSFLGIGFVDPTPSWGLLINAGRSELSSNPHLFLIPSAALALTVLSIVFISEGVRDALDPRLRGA
jgi:ABC-type dipeptide/oligopeptide/nickel transport system permease subunit